MIDHFFSRNHTPWYLRGGFAGPFLDGFAAALRDEGYVRSCGQARLRAAHHVGEWAEPVGVRVSDLDEEILARFKRHLPSCRCRRATKRRHLGFVDAPIGARRFLRYLREIGFVPAVPTPSPSAAAIDYAAWMRDRQGLAEVTIVGRLSVVEALLAALGEDPARFNAAAVRSFVLKYVRRHHPGSAGGVTTPVRGFLRYLVAQGRCATALVDAVPTIPSWRHARLPQYLSAHDVEKIIAGCNHRGRAAVRDRAMLLLLARLGLRAGDVRALKLDDLDWKRGRVRVAGKGRRETYLPLPQDVGDAVLAHLARRPAVAADHVFLRVSAPFRPLSAGGLKNAVTAAIKRTDVRAPSYGPHLLRHSLATRMLREGATLDLIGAVLRHRDIDTTAIYSKVDVVQLRQIARPWPGTEVSPC